MRLNFKKIFFYSISFFLTLIIFEIFLYFFLNFQWNLKDRPLGEENKVTKYYKSFHPLFRDLKKFNNDLIVYNKFLPYILSKEVYLYKNFRRRGGGKSIIEVDEFGYVHNGDKYSNKIFQSKKKIGEKRIVFIGGSTTFGTGASNNKNTYPAQVEYIIKKNNKKNNLFFLNAGVIGYNSFQEYLYFKNYLKKLEPDIVIFLHGSNDAYNSLTQEKFDKNFHEMEIFEKKQKNIFSFPQRLYLLNFSARLYAYLRFEYAVIKSKLVKSGKTDLLNSYYHKEAALEMKKNIENILLLLKESNTKAIFYLQPNLFLKTNYSDHEKNLLSMFTRSDFKKNVILHYLDFQNVYDSLNKKYSDNEKILFKDISFKFSEVHKDPYKYKSWTHFDDDGYYLLAKIISDDIKKLIKIN